MYKYIYQGNLHTWLEIGTCPDNLQDNHCYKYNATEHQRYHQELMSGEAAMERSTLENRLSHRNFHIHVRNCANECFILEHNLHVYKHPLL